MPKENNTLTFISLYEYLDTFILFINLVHKLLLFFSLDTFTQHFVINLTLNMNVCLYLYKSIAAVYRGHGFSFHFLPYLPYKL